MESEKLEQGISEHELADKIKVIVKNGFPHIDGRLCSYQTKKIRTKIQELAEVNEEFILPKKYTYVITQVNGFAKIVKKPDGADGTGNVALHTQTTNRLPND